MSRPSRYLPPIAGGAQKTGWEALEKWVGSGSGAAPAAETSSAPAGGGKTGWEALEKWVGDGTTPSVETSAANGGAGAEEAVASGTGSTTAEGAGGLMGFLKRLFGGK